MGEVSSVVWCGWTSKSGPIVVRFHMLTSKCALRHNSMHFLNILTSKIAANPRCWHFDFEIRLAPRWRALLFKHLNFQSAPELRCFAPFDLEMCFPHLPATFLLPFPPLLLHLSILSEVWPLNFLRWLCEPWVVMSHLYGNYMTSICREVQTFKLFWPAPNLSPPWHLSQARSRWGVWLRAICAWPQEKMLAAACGWWNHRRTWKDRVPRFGVHRRNSGMISAAQVGCPNQYSSMYSQDIWFLGLFKTEQDLFSLQVWVSMGLYVFWMSINFQHNMSKSCDWLHASTSSWHLMEIPQTLSNSESTCALPCLCEVREELWHILETHLSEVKQQPGDGRKPWQSLANLPRWTPFKSENLI